MNEKLLEERSREGRRACVYVGRGEQVVVRIAESSPAKEGREQMHIPDDEESR